MIEMATTKPPWGAGDLSNHLALIFKANKKMSTYIRNIQQIRKCLHTYTKNTYEVLILYSVKRFLSQGCKFSDFCLISENFTSTYLKMFFEISSL